MIANVLESLKFVHKLIANWCFKNIVQNLNFGLLVTSVLYKEWLNYNSALTLIK